MQSANREIRNILNWMQFAQRRLNTNIRAFLQDNSLTRSNVLTKTDDPPFSLISKFETQLVELQSLLIWENPRDSILALICFTFFYWTIVLLDPSIISVLASILFCYHFSEMWHRYVWPEIRVPTQEIKENWTSINPKVLSAPEIKQYFHRMKLILIEWLNRIIMYRRRSHGAFCAYSLMFFFCFYYIGHFISGIFITYCTAILIFLIPGFLAHVVPKNTFEDFFLDYLNNKQEHNDVEDRQLLAKQSRMIKTKPMHLLSTNESFYTKTLSSQTLSSMENLPTNEKKFCKDHYGMDCFCISSNSNSSNDNSSNSVSNTSSNCNSDSDSDFVMISESECAEL